MREPNTWLRAYAPGYGFLTRRERRAIYDFVVLWSVFEAQVLHCRANAHRMIEAVEHWNGAGLLADPLALQRMRESFTHFQERLTTTNGLSHRFEGLHIANVAHEEMVASAVQEDEPDALTCHKSLAVIIHRIRNNLLHGAKWSYALNDQEANFRHSSAVLMTWMDLDREQPFLAQEH